ncbi:MAG: type I-C CRISPR-associated endonuclease Cas1c [Actinomycetota bacterium]|nr:type I-C CRISPR-associated endonuclease Cas1c [Actinomycetota bacterium]
MKRLLNTLYVTSQGAYLARKGETVLVRVENETKFRVPLHNLDGIICFGQVTCSPPLMQICGERNISISFLSEYGRFWARVQGPISGNVILRREQYRRADDISFSSEVARNIVLVKVVNSRTVLLRAQRDHQEKIDVESLREATQQLSRISNKLKEMVPLDTARGYEGRAARVYFDVFNHLIVANKEDFFFHKRSRRPPMDNMNAVLSFIYALLSHDVKSALEAVGLDPAVGYLHKDRPGRPGLALDLMEELRPFFADRLALSLVNRKQLRGKGFKKTESGSVLMDDDTRKSVLVAYQKRKQDEIYHPFIKEKVALGLLPHIQAMLFSRFLRNDIDGYPPFIWR